MLHVQNFRGVPVDGRDRRHVRAEGLRRGVPHTPGRVDRRLLEDFSNGKVNQKPIQNGNQYCQGHEQGMFFCDRLAVDGQLA